MAKGYDNAAWFYDGLSKIVFGNSLIKSQTEFFNYIPPNSSILIVGGGTGWILETLAGIHPLGLKIIYVEVSEKMVNLAKKRNWAANTVAFIINDILNVKLDNKPGIVITPFLFDNFESPKAQEIFMHINGLLAQNGLWLNTGFQLTGKLWQWLLLKAMLVFFKLFGAVGNNTITDMQKVFEGYGRRKIAYKTFYRDFIRTEVWQ